jgi:hypothetical protein
MTEARGGVAICSASCKSRIENASFDVGDANVGVFLAGESLDGPTDPAGGPGEPAEREAVSDLIRGAGSSSNRASETVGRS